MLAWSAGTGLAVCWALTAFAIGTGAVLIRMEDKELENRFGEEYRRYRSTLPASSTFHLAESALNQEPEAIIRLG